MSQSGSAAPVAATPAAPAPGERLRTLVASLDALGSDPGLLDIARAMQGVRLTPSDVAGFVKANPRGYNRAAVVVREQYELLVMTWLPGQGSVPHDHSGSVCVMRVVQGAAAEACYRIAPDGFADLEHEVTLPAGGVGGFQDAGVHTLRNPRPDETLVTVHVYAPRLRDFRRFVARPCAPGDNRPAPQEPPTVVVVGGGFSGAMTAAQLMIGAGRAGLALDVVLIERRGAVGEGTAYATSEPAHLLNVPARGMSAWPDRPEDFLRWAQDRDGSVAPNDFLPRQWYGDYVRDVLRDSARDAGDLARLRVVYDEVRRVARRPGGGWVAHLAHGASLRAEAVVLAIGHRPPSDPLADSWTGPRTRLIADPWRPFATGPVRPDEPAIVIGSGLTAVDVVLSLAAQPRSAPVTLVSPYGLCPLAHAAEAITPADLAELVESRLAAPGGPRPLALLVALRKMARGDAAPDWRCLVDGLRPHTARLWQAMAGNERRRFLRHLQPFWEVHRHRMALAVAEPFQAMLESGAVRVIAGRLIGVQAEVDAVRAIVGPRGGGPAFGLGAGWVINCTGPTASNHAEANPVINSLLVHGQVRVDDLALGVETCADGAAIAADGARTPDMFVVGALRKAALWESIAAPELREQAAVAAARIIDRLATACVRQAPAACRARPA